MSTVYSKQLLAQSGVTALVTVQVPAGKIWILRDVDVYVNAGLAGSRFTLEGSASQAIYTHVTSPNTTESAQWRGRQVLGPLQTFAVKADDPTDVTVSGYELTAP